MLFVFWDNIYFIFKNTTYYISRVPHFDGNVVITVVVVVVMDLWMKSTRM